METTTLYHQLAEAYSDENLNRITRKLIELFKNKNFGKIRELANKVSKYVPIDEEKEAKCFTKLVILYHPDKGEFFRKSIKKHFDENDAENLTKHSHIFIFNQLENIVITTADLDIDYHPEYFWDTDQSEDYEFSDENETEEEAVFDDEDFEKSFYNAIKIREYGRLDIEFPTYYLEDFEDFEMTECGIETLDGVEFCKHVKILDLSNNEIADLSQLWGLTQLEELYLAHNQIGYIDTLCNLQKLKIIDLSENQIDDISPLLELEQLEYVNLIGNPVSRTQVERLRAKGTIVMY